MKRVSWHFLHQMVFAFLVLTPLHLSAQDYYHQLNVRIVNNSGVEMSAYVDVGGLDNGYSSKSCFTGMNNQRFFKVFCRFNMGTETITLPA